MRKNVDIVTGNIPVSFGDNREPVRNRNRATESDFCYSRRMIDAGGPGFN